MSLLCLASIASAAYVAVILLLVIAGYLAGQPLKRAELFVGYDSYRFFNHVQTAALPVAVLALCVARRRTWSHAIAGIRRDRRLCAAHAGDRQGHVGGHLRGGWCGQSALLFGRRALAMLRDSGHRSLVGLGAFCVAILVGAGCDGGYSIGLARYATTETGSLVTRADSSSGASPSPM